MLGSTNPQTNNVAAETLDIFGVQGSHLKFVTHARILTSKRSSKPYGQPSPHLERSPTIYKFPKESINLQFRYYVLASLHFRRRLPASCEVEQ